MRPTKLSVESSASHGNPEWRADALTEPRGRLRGGAKAKLGQELAPRKPRRIVVTNQAR